MVTKLFDLLYVRDDTECRHGTAETAVVHACKSPCDQRALGYRGSLPSSHLNYLVLRNGSDRFLYLVDPPIPLFQPVSFKAFIEFLQEKYDAGADLLIHCNQGESRSTSLALPFLAKHEKAISEDSSAAARADFLPPCPHHRPGAGISRFLKENWRAL